MSLRYEYIFKLDMKRKSMFYKDWDFHAFDTTYCIKEILESG